MESFPQEFKDDDSKLAEALAKAEWDVPYSGPDYVPGGRDELGRTRPEDGSERPENA